MLKVICSPGYCFFLCDKTKWKEIFVSKPREPISQLTYFFLMCFTLLKTKNKIRSSNTSWFVD